MAVQTQVKEFDWVGELHQTMVKSLSTSFGLDFLLFQDKRGGNVDTVHKVREYQQESQKNGKTDIHVSTGMETESGTGVRSERNMMKRFQKPTMRMPDILNADDRIKNCNGKDDCMMCTVIKIWGCMKNASWTM